MSITRVALQQNRVTLTAVIIVLAAGMFTYVGMPRDYDPGFIIRTAQIITYFPGASPERVELLVTDKIEKAIQEMPEIDFISSTSKNGVSIVLANVLPEYTQMRPIWDSLRRKVDRAQGDLPEGIRGPFVNDEFGDVFGTMVTITGEGLTYAELKEVADEVRDELLLIPQAAKVEIQGAQEERVFIEYSNARLAELGISPIQLQNVLEGRNIIIPGGSITTGQERLVLEPSGNFESVEELRSSLLSLPGRNELVQLQDVARVTRGYVDPPGSMVRSTGAPALVLSVSLREGGNVVELGGEVRSTIRRLTAIYPIGVEFDFVAEQAVAVDKKISDFVMSLLQAVAIVMAVMLLSLGLRTGLVVASLIPSAIIMALFFMGLFKIGLDQISLASLIIALGMLVDNAIVMSESIMVQMADGTAPVEAAVGSARELQVPLLVSSLTTAAAFLPIFLAESSVGEYTAPLFKVVTLTLLCSWVLAITLIPLLCVQFLRVAKREPGDSFDSPFYRRYRGLLLALLRRPVITLIAVAGIFFLTLQGFRFIPAIFFPPNDRPLLTAELRMPTGTPIERTSAVVQQIEDFVSENLMATPETPGIVNWASFVGEGAPRFVVAYNPEPPSPEYAVMLVNTDTRDAVDAVIPRIEAFCWENFPDLEFTIKPLPNGPPVNYPVEVRLTGRDREELFEVVEEVKEHMRAEGRLRNVSDNWGLRSKKIVVQINQARARRAGVSNQDIAVSLQTGLSGLEITQYREEDEVIPITMRSVAADRQDLGKLESLNVFSQLTGSSVPLKQVADVRVVWQPAKVIRRDRLTTVTARSGLVGDVTAAEVNADLVPWLDERVAARDGRFSYELGGEDEASSEGNESIGEKLPIAVLLIILLLVGQFNSIRRPIIVLITIPLGLIGVVAGLLIARSYFGFMTLLGVISLAGIVINNAIVLLDRIKIEIEQNGLSPQKAVIESAQRRLRPILLTTCTTIGGLLPLWFGGGPMWEPMAITIIFGLLFATTLTLGVVPVLYALFFRVRFRDFTYS